MLIQWKDNKRGISVIEILVVIFIIVIALVGLFSLVVFSLKISNLIKETSQANSLAQETIEAVRNFRDGTGWNTDGLNMLTAGISYYPQKSGDTPPKWQIIPGEEIIDGFTRKVVFNQVYRDANDDIIEAGGMIDPNTKKVIATVSWKDKKVEIITYLTNWR